jgi:hypothetical protein
MTEGDEEDPKPRPFSLFGLDIYMLAFIAIGGSFVAVGIFLLFFSNGPLPRYCGSGLHSTPVVCGWISRDPPATNSAAP